MPGSAGPRHGFVWGYSAGETGWGLGGFNPNFAKLEALLHLSVTSITSTPPITPAAGMVYIVGGSPTGAWVGHAGAVAAYYATGWLFIAPVTGVRAWNVSTSTYWRYSGSAWVEEPASGNVSGPATSVAGAVPVYADGTGKLLDDSGIDFDSLLQIGGPLVPANLVAVDGVGRAIDSGIGIGGLGTGTVVGPAVAVAGNLASYYDATGEVIDDSGIPAADVALIGGTLVEGNLVTVNAGGDLVDAGIAVGDSGGASVTVADTAPLDPAVGDLWWDSNDGQLYLFFDSYWVAATNKPGPAGPAGSSGMSGMVSGQIPIAASPTTVASSGNLSGDVTTSGSLNTTLATVNSSVGTFQGLMLDAKGRVTGATNQGYLPAATAAATYAPLANPVFTGTVTGAAATFSGQVTTGNLTAAGVLKVNNNATTVLEISGNYTLLYSPDSVGGTGGVFIGNTVDPQIIYRNTSHAFTNRDGSAAYAILDTNGLALQSGAINVIAGPYSLTVPAGQSIYFKHAAANYFYDSADALKFALNNTDGEAYKTVAGSWVGLSDRRIKQQVEEFRGGLDIIEQLNPIEYEHNGRAGTDKGGRRYVGLMADEVFPVVPEMIGRLPVQLDVGDKEFTDILTIDPSRLVYLLLNAVKELAVRVAELEAAR